MTEREAAPNWDFDYGQDDPYEDDGWFGREQVAEPAAVSEVPDRDHAQPANNVREEAHAPPPVVHSAPSPASPTVSTWTVNGQLRASNNSALTFRSPPPPWYRTKQATIAIIAAASAAVAVPLVLLVWPSSPGTPATGPAESTSVAPQPSTGAQPAPSSAEPTPINAPPPPPPPPPEDTDSAPADTQPQWTRPAPEPTEKPDVGVTRTPVTRAPISVAPVPRQPSENNSATPGDGPKRGCGGWC